MKKLFFLIIVTFFVSCRQNQEIITTDLNLVAKVVKIKPCKNCIDGGFVYTMEVNPEEKQYIKYVTDCVYKKGEFIYFKMITQKID